MRNLVKIAVAATTALVVIAGVANARSPLPTPGAPEQHGPAYDKVGAP